MAAAGALPPEAAAVLAAASAGPAQADPPGPGPPPAALTASITSFLSARLTGGPARLAALLDAMEAACPVTLGPTGDAARGGGGGAGAWVAAGLRDGGLGALLAALPGQPHVAAAYGPAAPALDRRAVAEVRAALAPWAGGGGRRARRPPVPGGVPAATALSVVEAGGGGPPPPPPPLQAAPGLAARLAAAAAAAAASVSDRVTAAAAAAVPSPSPPPVRLTLAPAAEEGAPARVRLSVEVGAGSEEEEEESDGGGGGGGATPATSPLPALNAFAAAAAALASLPPSSPAITTAHPAAARLVTAAAALLSHGLRPTPRPPPSLPLAARLISPAAALADAAVRAVAGRTAAGVASPSPDPLAAVRAAAESGGASGPLLCGPRPPPPPGVPPAAWASVALVEGALVARLTALAACRATLARFYGPTAALRARRTVAAVLAAAAPADAVPVSRARPLPSPALEPLSPASSGEFEVGEEDGAQGGGWAVAMDDAAAQAALRAVMLE